MHLGMCPSAVAFFHKQELLGPLLRRKRNAPGGMGGTRLGSWGPAEFGWVARGFGLGGPRFWTAGTWLRSWGPAEFGWVARGFGAGDPRSLDGWHAALGGARGVWMGGTRLWRGPRSLGGWHGARGTKLWSWGLARMGGGPAGSGSGTGGAGGPRSLDGWQGARGFDACAGHL